MSSKRPALVKVRILTDCIFGLVGEVAEIPADMVARAKQLALVDDDPEAVRYAEQQREAGS